MAHEVRVDKTRGLAVALSGGGHRATLFTIGALLAIVDRHLNTRVEQISSVSGGSITNAFVAQRCDFGQLRPGDLDAVASELIRIVVNRGVITRNHALVFSSLSLLIAVVTGTASWFVAEWSIRPFPNLVPWVALLGGLIGLAAAPMWLGRYVERRLERIYFRGPNLGTAPASRMGFRRGRGPVTLGTLPNRSVEHVFCATDLVAGSPVYFSTWDGGLLWRRTNAKVTQGILETSGQRFDARKLTLAEVVRASAAFPGIPPRRMVLLPSFPHKPSWIRLRRIRGTERKRHYFGKPLTDELRARLDAEEETVEGEGSHVGVVLIELGAARS